MVRKGLLNRVLPAILSAAMVFTNVPTNALAAETPVETASGQYGGGISQEVAAGSEEAQTTGEANEPVDDDTSQDTFLQGADGNETEDNYEAVTNLPTPVINIQRGQIQNNIAGTGMAKITKYYDVPEETFFTDYRNAVTVGTQIYNVIKNDLLGAYTPTTSIIEVTADGYIDDEPVSQDVLATWREELQSGVVWQSTADNGASWTDLAKGAQPDKPGTYRLLLTLPETSRHKAAEETAVYLTVEKTRIEVVPAAASARPGSTYQELIDANTDSYEIKAYNLGGDYWTTLNDKSFVADTSTIVVREATVGADGAVTVNTDTTAADGATKLTRDKSYALCFNIVLTDEVKDYYELGDNIFPVTLGEMWPAYWDVEYTDVSAGIYGITKAYDGKEATADLVNAAIKTDNIIYYEEYWTSSEKTGTKSRDNVSKDESEALAVESTKAVALEGFKAKAGAEGSGVTSYWAEKKNGSDYVRLDSAPIDAGVYYYVFEFTDPTGSYSVDPLYVPVSITDVAVTVKPRFSTITTPMAGMTAKELLADVDYDVIDASGQKLDIDKTSFWGTFGYGQNFTTSQSFEPVFAVQYLTTEDGKDVVKELKVNVDPDDDLDDEEYKLIAGGKYRIVFTGKKAVFKKNRSTDYDGTDTTTPVNNETNNYRVNVAESVTLAAGNFIDISSVTAGAVTAIGVDEIVKVKDESGAKGKAFSTPIESSYTGKSMYANKGEYKKATVTANGAAVTTTEDSLTYSWQRFGSGADGGSKLDPFFDEETGKVLDPPATEPQKPTKEESSDDPDWIAYNKAKDQWDTWKNAWETIKKETGAFDDTHYFTDAENWPAPSVPGIYRLKIDYTDKTHANQDATAYVYYVIHKMDAVAEISGEPVVYADGVTTAGSYKASLQSTNAADKDTYITIALYSQTAAADGSVGKEAIELPESTQKKLISAPQDYLKIERKEVKNDVTLWKEEENESEIIYEGPDTESYRLTFDPDDIEAENYYGETYPLVDYYNFFGAAVGTHNQGLKNVVKTVSSVVLTVKNSDGAPVYITLDEDKLASSQVYNGKAIDLTNLVATVKLVDSDEEVKDVTVRYSMLREKAGVAPSDWEEIPAEQAVHAGSYKLRVYTNATEKYRKASADSVTDFVIEKKEIEVLPEFKAPVKAGTYANYPYNIKENVVERWAVSDIADEVSFSYDKNGETVTFTESKDKILDLEKVNYSAKVYKTEDNIVPTANIFDGNNYRNYLTSGDKYYVYIDTDAWYGADPFNKREDAFGNEVSYKQDYKVKDIAAEFVPVRNSAEVYGYNSDSPDFYEWGVKENAKLSTKVAEPTKVETIGDYALEYTHTISALSGIPVDVEVATDITGKDTHKNILQFRIKRPNEFDARGIGFIINSNQFQYRESIERAIKSYGGNLDYEGVKVVDNDYIEITLDAGLIQEKIESGKIAFDIVWDLNSQYVEHFYVDLSDASLKFDLTTASAPKKLTFNAVTKKMAVGDTQQLDVKITKVQAQDVIWLGYSSDNEEVIAISDEADNDANGEYKGGGFITALNKGSAKVSVFPCVQTYDAETGKVVKKAIEGFKPVTVKITVGDVAKVKLSKVKAYDTEVTFQYKKPANGYRREYYVLEAPAKAADFEAKIAEVKNGDYSAFVYASIADNERDAKGNSNDEISVGALITNGEVEKLEPNKKYVVYVRNVSGLRTLEDGATVASSAAGVVKAVKTTKPQEHHLEMAVKEGEYADVDKYKSTYQVMLAQKTATIETSGLYYEKYSKDYSDSEDSITRLLPLTGDDKKTYLAPKLKYYVYESGARILSEKPDKSVSKSYVYDSVRVEWYPKTDIAAINNKGKLTLKGEGLVTVRVVNTVNGNKDELDVFIDSKPDSMTAKTAKLQSGDSIYLSELLGYKEGSTNVVNYQGYRDLDNDWHKMFADLSVAESSDENYKIKKEERSYYSDKVWDSEKHDFVRTEVKFSDYRITALKASGSKDLTVTDAEVLSNGGSSVTVKLTTAALEPVKKLSLKYSYVENGKTVKAGGATDYYAEGAFWHTMGKITFRQNLYDSKGVNGGKLIRSDVITRSGEWDAKKKSYRYDWSVGGSNNFNLTPMQNYVLTVTVVNDLGNETETSKEATLKFKTSNVIASDNDLASTDHNKGVLIYLDQTKYNTVGGVHLGQYPVLTSGNTYTLTVAESANGGTGNTVNSTAIARKSDTLTWKVLNTKIAKVKVKPGTYSAQLTAVKPGTTELQLTSKLTKKVISRWSIIVGAVANANSYYGTNEPFSRAASWGYSYTKPQNTELERDILELSIGNVVSVKLNGGERQWFVFEAPAYGNYTITYGGESETFTMKKGEKVYVSVSAAQSISAVTYSATVEGYAFETVSGSGARVRGGDNAHVSFVAPEDNYYTFKYTDDNGSVRTSSKALKAGKEYSFELKNTTDGKEYEITIEKREPAAVSENAAGSYELGDAPEGSIYAEKWFVFEASEDGLYTFTKEDTKDGETVKHMTSVDVFDSIMDEYPTDSFTTADKASEEIALAKGDKVWFRVRVSGATAEELAKGSLTVTKTAIKAVKTEENKLSAIPKAVDGVPGYLLYSWTPDTKGVYTLKFAAADGVTGVTIAQFGDLDDLTATGTGLQPTITVTGDNIGKPIYFKVYNSNDEAKDATLTIAKREYNALSATGKAVSIEQGGYIYYEFNVPKKGDSDYYEYVFKASEEGAGLNVKYRTSENPESWSGDQGGATNGTKEVKFNLSNKEFTQMVFRVKSDTKCEITATATAVTYTDIALNASGVGTATVTAAKAGQKYYFKFAAETNDVYAFKFSSKTGTPTVTSSGAANFTNEETDNVDSLYSRYNEAFVSRAMGNILFTVTAPAGADNDLTVTVTKRAVKPLHVGDDNELKVPAGYEGAWYSFAAPEKNVYSFQFAATADTDTITIPYIYSGITLENNLKTTLSTKTGNKVTIGTVGTDDGNNIGYGNAWSTLNTNLNNLKTVYFKVTGTAAVTGAITVTQVDRAELTLKEAQKMTFDKDTSEKWYQFTANVDDDYTFVLSTTDKVNDDDYASVQADIYNYGSTTAHYNGTTAFSTTDTTTGIVREYVSIDAGEKVWIRVKNNQTITDTLKSVDAVIKVVRKPVVKLAEKEPATFSLETDGSVLTGYTFRVTETGFYTLEVKADKDGDTEPEVSVKDIYLNDDYIDDGTAKNSDAFKKTFYAEKNDVLTFDLGLYSENYTKAVTGSVTVTKITAKTLTDTASEFTVAEGDEVYYTYKVTENGLYKLSLTESDKAYTATVMVGSDEVEEWKNGNGAKIDLTTTSKAAERSYLFSKNDVVNVRIVGTGLGDGESAKGTIKIEEAPVTELKSGAAASDISIEAKVNSHTGEQWFSFNATQNTLYTLLFKDVKKGEADAEVSYTVYKADTDEDDEDVLNYYREYPDYETPYIFRRDGNETTEYFVKVYYDNFGTDEKITGKLSVTAPKSLILNTDTAFSLTNKDNEQVFRFTAASDADEGFYTFAFTPNDTKKEFNISYSTDGENFGEYEPVNTFARVVAAGDSVYVKLTNETAFTGDSDTIGGSIKVTEGVATTGLTLEEESTVAVPANSEMWLKVQTNEDSQYGLYNLFINGDKKDVSAGYTVEDSNGTFERDVDDNYFWYDAGIYYEFEERNLYIGERVSKNVYIRLVNTNNTVANKSVTVEEQTNIFSDGLQWFDLSAGETKHYSYRMPTYYGQAYLTQFKFYVYEDQGDYYAAVEGNAVNGGDIVENGAIKKRLMAPGEWVDICLTADEADVQQTILITTNATYDDNFNYYGSNVNNRPETIPANDDLWIQVYIYSTPNGRIFAISGTNNSADAEDSVTAEIYRAGAEYYDNILRRYINSGEKIGTFNYGNDGGNYTLTSNNVPLSNGSYYLHLTNTGDAAVSEAITFSRVTEAYNQSYDSTTSGHDHDTTITDAGYYVVEISPETNLMTQDVDIYFYSSEADRTARVNDMWYHDYYYYYDGYSSSYDKNYAEIVHLDAGPVYFNVGEYATGNYDIRLKLTCLDKD